MKKIALWLSVMALGLCLGCTPEPKPHVNLKFREGQIVDLKIGGRGQIVNVTKDGRYQVRIQTDKGSRYETFREFELMDVDRWSS